MSQNNARRTFLRGGAVLAASAALTACGATKEAPKTDKASAEEARKQDAVLITKGAVLEGEAIKIYTIAAGLSFIKSDAVVLQTAGRFMGQHQEHFDRLNALAISLGGVAAKMEDIKIRDIPKNITDASLPEAERKAAVIVFARTLEMQAAHAYLDYIVTRLQTQEARRVVAEIMPVEAQHVAIYDTLIAGNTPSDGAFLSDQKG